jgi:DNA invertase Pin-like site-specific DNA recombinase
MTVKTPSTPSASRSRAGSPTGGCAADATSPTPPSMADRPQRAAAYIRESTEEQGQGFSPDAQRQAIANFAPENDLELIGEYCDFHSGWRKSEARPEFQRLMADAAAGRFDVVLVYHTSRFARNQVEARRYKQLLRERLGIRVISVTQPMGEDHTDPSAFLAESIHEMFDEYYSVSLSFWTRSGLKEKARQGHLVGGLPWGYVRDLASRLAVPHAERAPLVLEMFERYATGHESDRTLAAWLNAKGARTARDRIFGKDTVREMLCNAAYAGYVTGLRSKDRSIRGLHEAIVPEELFDRVQEVRSWRTKVVKPGRPSEEYLLRKLVHCERCGARMHGCRSGRKGMRRYQCSTRRHHGTCEQTMIAAQPLEEQLVDWLHGFQPDTELRRLMLDAIRAETAGHPGEDADRRRELTAQLERLRELYVMGDITKSQDVMRRQMMEEELQRTKPPTDPDLDRAQALLEDFAQFWDTEPQPAERRKLLLSLFAQVWAKDGAIVAVKPNTAFARYFTAASEVRAKHPKGRAADEATIAGATGLEPAASGVTGRSKDAEASIFSGLWSVKMALSGVILAHAVLKAVPAETWYSCGTLCESCKKVTARPTSIRPARCSW